MTKNGSGHSGRTRAVVVFGDQAVLTRIVARTTTLTSTERIHFAGPADFDAAAQEHLRAVVVPVVDRLREQLAMAPVDFEVSVTNIAAAAQLDRGARITGYSADAPVLVAALSAGLGIRVADDIALTGHVASMDGDIVAVLDLPAKLAALRRERSVHRLVYPDLAADQSLSVLTPNQLQQATDALVAASADLRLLPVCDVADLVAAVFSEEAIVLGALAAGFFETSIPDHDTSNPIQRAAAYLTQRLEQWYWTALEGKLLAGNAARAKAILAARLRFEAQRHRYPRGFGRRLCQLIGSIPPATRRTKLRRPLVDPTDCIRLSQFAAAADHADVVLLFEVSAGRAPARPAPAVPVRETRPVSGNRGQLALDTVLAQISEPALVQAVRQPIDVARACYILEHNTFESAEEFNDTVAAFYLHLIRHVCDVPLQVTTMDAAPEALDLLARAFAEQGGDKAARQEARDAIHGGLRYVLDVMTDRFAREQSAKHIHRIFKEVIDPLDFIAQKEVTAALIERALPSLPPEMQDVPPGVLATHHERLIGAYARSLDLLRQEIRHLRT